MLDSVKKFIKEEEKPFIFYFNEYIIYIQDTLIDKEMAFLLRNNSVDIEFLSKLIDDSDWW